MKILIFDTETGGVNAEQNDILQLSYQITDGGTFKVLLLFRQDGYGCILLTSWNTPLHLLPCQKPILQGHYASQSHCHRKNTGNSHPVALL